MKITKILTTVLTAVVLTNTFTIFNVKAEDETEVKNPYQNEVFSDVGVESNIGERTQNTGYNIKVRSSRYDNVQYQPIPVIDCFVERIGLDYAGYSYYGGYHYSYEAFKNLKDNGCEYVLLYLGQSPWDDSKIFNKNKVRDFSDSLMIALENANKAGVKIGLIWEGNAVSLRYAFKEAEYVYNTIKEHDLKFTLPLFYAPEYSTGAVSYENRTLAVKAFFDRLNYLGYEGNLGLYTNGNTNQGATIDANVITDAIPNICIWVPAYDHYNRPSPNFDNILYMHQYTGDYGLVPDRQHTLLNGVGYQLDISMAFPERPGSISNIYIDGNYISWDSVENADNYKIRTIYSDYTYDEIITNNTNIMVSDDAVKVYVKALRTDKFNFTSESYNWIETPNDWKVFDFETIDLSEYYINDEGNTNNKMPLKEVDAYRYKLMNNGINICYEYTQNVIENVNDLIQ